MNLCNISEIRSLLEKHGFHFSKSMGQNFLTESWVPQRIADSAHLDSNTGVLEIGPGIGCLTVELSQQAGKVVSIELDRSLMPILSETLGDCGNTEVIFSDILKMDISSLVTEKFKGFKPVVCANLPYNITTPIFTALIDAQCFSEITVMIQREVAQRICASAGSKEYGAFTVYMQYYTEPTMLFDVSPGCFIPAPKVHSSVLQLKMREAPAVSVQNEKLFFRVVKAAFAQRRKTLLNTLSAGFSAISKREIEEILVSCRISPSVRGETLELIQFARIADALHVRLSG